MATYPILCSCDYLRNGELLLEDCEGYSKLRDALWSHFKFNNFRPGQLEALLPAAHGKDVFVRMPTGGGKSLCMYLVPLAMSDKAIGVVVSPLVSLMDQQVKQLSDVGVSAIRVSSPDIMPDIAKGKYRFVFLSPETVQLPSWKEVVSSKVFKRRLAVVAVDEAHCISEWGKDFRTAFDKIGGLRALTDVPFIALTASAPSDIQDVIVTSLHLKDPVFVSCDLDRPNIYMSVNPIKSLNQDLDGLVQSLKSPLPDSVPKTLVFTQTKDKAWKVFHMLRLAAANKSYVGMYHASQTQRTKLSVQQAFTSVPSDLRCLVATIAFGMGMDIPDVEVVVVYGLPKTATQLYQLFGRAGRNGCLARGHLFYSEKKDKKGKVKPVAVEDVTLSEFVTGAKSCRRSALVYGMGGNDIVRPSERCCDKCTPQAIAPNDRLNILEIGKVSRSKKRAAARFVNEELLTTLKNELRMERDRYIQENPFFLMTGFSFVCPDVTIEELCSQATYIQTPSDMSLFGIKLELRDRFFNIISSILSEPASSKRRCCV